MVRVKMGEKSLRELEEEIAETRRIVLDMMDRTRQELESFKQELKEIREESKKALGSLAQSTLFSTRYSNLNSLISDILLAVRAAKREPGASKQLIESTLLEVGKFFNEFSVSPLFSNATISASTTFVGTLIAATYLDSGFSFDELASILLETFPSEVAKKIVPLEYITKFYGAESAIKWKKLVGIL